MNDRLPTQRLGEAAKADRPKTHQGAFVDCEMSVADERRDYSALTFRLYYETDIEYVTKPARHSAQIDPEEEAVEVFELKGVSLIIADVEIFLPEMPAEFREAADETLAEVLGGDQ